MYYPKSQIKPNQYTKGEEFKVKRTNKPYKGPYYITSKNELFTGKNPNDLPTERLIPIPLGETSSDSITDQRFSLKTPSQLEQDNSNFWASQFIGYNPKLDKYLTKTNPKTTYPSPSTTNYQAGEFERYFLKKSNEAKFIEISKEDYQMYVNKDNSVPYELYTPTKISWVLKGNKDQVYQANKNIVGKVEREQNYYGFSSYFKDNFTQFYQ
jgi:hypothetical protein